MSELVRDRLVHHLEKLQLSQLATTLDDYLAQATKQKWSYTDLLDRLFEEEIAHRQHRRINTALKLAGFPAMYTLDSFDFAFQPSIEKVHIKELATLSFVGRKENLIFLGPPGVGKTHLAIALGIKAIQVGYSVYFTSMDRMVKQLRELEGPRFIRKLRTYVNPALLIIDEVGYLPLNRHEAHLVFQLISGRYEKGSVIMTSNKTFTEWGEVFGDEVLVTAMLDRLMHHAEVLSIKGQSYRLRGKKLDGSTIAKTTEKNAKSGKEVQKNTD